MNKLLIALLTVVFAAAPVFAEEKKDDKAATTAAKKAAKPAATAKTACLIKLIKLNGIRVCFFIFLRSGRALRRLLFFPIFFRPILTQYLRYFGGTVLYSVR